MVSNRSNIVATKSLSSPFGYNDCDDPALFSKNVPQQVLGTLSGTQNNYSALDNDSKFNQFNQYPLPTPPLPPNKALQNNAAIGKYARGVNSYVSSKSSF